MKGLITALILLLGLVAAGFHFLGIGGAVVGFFVGVGIILYRHSRSLLARILKPAIWIGGVFFVLGFFGPLVIGGGGAQGPLLGFIIAPFGFCVGVVIGYVFNLRQVFALQPAIQPLHVAFFALALIMSVRMGVFILPTVEGLPAWLAARESAEERLLMTPSLTAGERELLANTHFDLRVAVETSRHPPAYDEGLVRALSDTGLFTEVAFRDRLGAPPDLVARAEGSRYWGDKTGQNFTLRLAGAPVKVAIVNVYYRIGGMFSQLSERQRFQERLAVEVIRKVNELRSAPLRPETAAALAGPLRVWRVEPPMTARERSQGGSEERRLEFTKQYLDGPLTDMAGGWEATFVLSKNFSERFRSANKEGRGPDLVIGDSLRALQRAFAEEALEERMLLVSDHFFVRRAGPFGFIDRESANAKLLRAFALGDRLCRRPMARPHALSAELEALSERLADAYLAGDVKAIQAYEDDRRLRVTRIGNDVDVARVLSVRTCGIWGNSVLAFTEVVATYEAERSLGRATLLLVFCKRQNGWRLLTIARDRVSLRTMKKEIPKLAALLESGSADASTVQGAELVAPADGAFPSPARDQRFGDFIWSPSASPTVVAEIAEFAYRRSDDDVKGLGRNDVRIFIHFRSAEGAQPMDRISSRRFRTMGGPWKWRVWSVNKDGAIGFSDVRVFRH